MGPGGFLRVVPLHTTALLGDKHYSPVAGAVPTGGGGPGSSGRAGSSRAGGGLDAVATSSELPGGVLPGLVDERVWVIKLLKKHARLCRGGLLTFRNVLMPAAWQCHLAAQAAQKAGLLGNALQMKGRVRQIWGLLPSLCAAPTDTVGAFGPGGKFLADLLGVLKSEDRKDLHAAVCSGLGVLIVRHRLAVGLDAVGRPEFMGGGSGAGDGASVRTGLTGATGNDALTFLGGVTSFYLDADASTIGGMSRGTGSEGGDDDARSTASGGGPGGSGTVIPLGQRHPSLLRAAGNGLRVPVLAHDEAEAGLEAIAKGARQLLPQLLTTYQRASAAEEGRAQRVLECVAAYFAAAPQSLAAGVFKKALERMSQSIRAGEEAAAALRAASGRRGKGSSSGGAMEEDGDGGGGDGLPAEGPEAEALRGASTRAASYLSLALAMVPRLPPAQCGQLWLALRPAVISSAIKGQQKRAYKVMASLLQTHAQVFLADAKKIQAVAGLLHDSRATCAAGSQRLRLRCLRALARALDPAESR